MPYYKWQGVDIHAHTKTGWLYSDSIPALSNQLFQKEIALLRARVVRVWRIQKPTLETKIAVTSRVATLLTAGLSVPAAFELVAETSGDRSIKCALFEAAFLISAGGALHEVIKRHALFDSALVGLTEVSSSTGNIAYAFEHTFSYLQVRKNLKSSVWAALHTPLITLVIFFALLVAMIVFIVPQFAAVYKTFNGVLPIATLQMVALSTHVKDMHFWISFIVLSGFSMAIIMFLRLWMRATLDQALLHVPGIGRMIRCYNYAFFLLSVGQLLQAGLSLCQSLKAAQSMVKNSSLQKTIAVLITEIEHGVPLHVAMKNNGKWDIDTIALVTVGYESGTLSQMILQSSQLYQSHLSKSLSRLVVLMQPCLLVILGLVIGFCVYALYAPLFSLGNLV